MADEALKGLQKAETAAGQDATRRALVLDARARALRRLGRPAPLADTLAARRALNEGDKTPRKKGTPDPNVPRQQLINEVQEVMRARHRLKVDQENDFDILTSDTIMNIFDQFTRAIFLASSTSRASARKTASASRSCGGKTKPHSGLGRLMPSTAWRNRRGAIAGISTTGWMLPRSSA